MYESFARLGFSQVQAMAFEVGEMLNSARFCRGLRRHKNVILMVVNGSKTRTKGE